LYQVEQHNIYFLLEQPMTTQKPVDVTLSARCRVRRANTAKCRVVTEVTIFVGSIIVATATLGGNWTPPKALAEFKRQLPGRFKPAADYSVAVALGYAA
jgi:hypothetical protein